MDNLNIYDLHFCVRRLPKNLRAMMEKHGKRIIVAGGYVRSIIAREKISDVDVFAGNKQASSILATELQGNDKFHKTDNAFTVTKVKPVVQFIFRWVFEKPADIVDSFDFSISQVAFWFDAEAKKWDSLCSDKFYQDLSAKRLVYLSPVRNEDAGGSLLRVLKYYQRGYRIPLDSFGAVIARLVSGIDFNRTGNDEVQIAKIISGLLFEVDPNGFIDHQAYLPSETQINQNEEGGKNDGKED